MELQWNLCPFCANHHIDPYHDPVRARLHPESRIAPIEDGETDEADEEGPKSHESPELQEQEQYTDVA